MAISLALVVLSFFCVAAQVNNGYLIFSMSPSLVELCGNHRTSEVHLDCHLMVHATKIYSMEIGVRRGTGGVRHLPVVRLDGSNTLSFFDRYHPVHLNATHRNWTTGSMTFTMANPVMEELSGFYCTATYIYHNTLMYSEKYAQSTAFHYSSDVPKCSKTGVQSAVGGTVPTNYTITDKCPNGHDDRPEDFVIKYCKSPDIKDWKAGPKVMDICCEIPSYTPVATVSSGTFLQGKQGGSGVFIECIPNGFSMAFQRCGDAPMIVNVTRSLDAGYEGNPDNYQVMLHANSQLVKNPIIG